MYLSRSLALAAVLCLFSPSLGLATNGMNMEGYGPVASGMGGASFAYENGAAAVMNNPATLSLMRPGTSRLDVAAGLLGPNVSASVRTPGGSLSSESDAGAFIMPAAGWVRKDGRLTYGLAAFAQGGMGTQYASDSWMADPSQGLNTSLTIGLENRTEVSVGRAIVPLAYELTDRLSIGGSFDFVWAGMDLRMAMSESQFQDLMTTRSLGSASGTMTGVLGALYEPFGGRGLSRIHHAYFDFSNDNKFTGEALGYGVAGKLGLVYKAAPSLTLGATYHSETSLSDLETDRATMSMGVNIDTGIAQGGAPSGTYVDTSIPVTGTIRVQNFEWPATYGVGLAYTPTSRWMIAGDIKRIGWASVMKEFRMTFESDAIPENGGFGGLELETTLLQKWGDQTVFSFGGQYLFTDRMTLRAGFNLSNNPVPSEYLNALFPAIIEDHIALGMGYRVSPRSEMNLSVFKALESEVVNPGNGSTIPEVTSTHDQLNLSLMFTQVF